MTENYCFFEDNHLEYFHPLTLTRPIFDLRSGILTLGEKWLTALQVQSTTKPSGILREHLKGVFQPYQLNNTQKYVTWINPRFIPGKELVQMVNNLHNNSCLLHEENIVAAKISIETHGKWSLSEPDFQGLKVINIDISDDLIFRNSWELFQQNGKQIALDIELLNFPSTVDSDQYPHVTFINEKNIFVEDGAVIEPGAIIIADKGPVYVGKNAKIMASAIIRGASAICEKSVVKMGAKIYEDTTIGPVCKVGGEISNVIFHSYSNKAHDGYAGNSVFGQWCNLGADTNTSNLKNNYSSVKVFDWKTKKEFDTGEQFIGTIMGDHSKTGINSMLNTGTMCGVCCNLFSENYPPKHVPSFSWVSTHDIVPYHFEKAVEAMEKMMARRDIPFTKAYHKMMKAIFQSTSF